MRLSNLGGLTVTIHLTRYAGFNVRRLADANDRKCWFFVVWYPRLRQELGFLYFSL